MTGLSKWDKPYQKEARPTTYMSIDLKILIPPEERSVDQPAHRKARIA